MTLPEISEARGNGVKNPDMTTIAFKNAKPGNGWATIIRELAAQDGVSMAIYIQRAITFFEKNRYAAKK
jgi:hypothetical protein